MPGLTKYPARTLVFFFTLLFMVSCSTVKPPVHQQAQDLTKAVPAETLSEQTGNNTQLHILEGKISLLEERVEALEARISSNHTASLPEKPVAVAKTNTETGHSPASSQTPDPVTLYNQGRQRLLAHEVSQAASSFSIFLKNYPDHDLADNALYWLGECSYTTGNYEESIESFKRVVQNYPKGQKVPDALLKIGYAYISIDDVHQATLYLKRVITQYPFSPAAEKAQTKLSQIQ